MTSIDSGNREQFQDGRNFYQEGLIHDVTNDYKEYKDVFLLFKWVLEKYKLDQLNAWEENNLLIFKIIIIIFRRFSIHSNERRP